MVVIKKIFTQVLNNFEKTYVGFKDFKSDYKYKKLWNLCLNTIENKQMLYTILFCNDALKIPPVQTFIQLRKDEIAELKSDNNLFKKDGNFKSRIKQCIGAFWGMVFQYTDFKYADRIQTFVVKEKNFGVTTASRFICKDNNGIVVENPKKHLEL